MNVHSSAQITDLIMNALVIDDEDVHLTAFTYMLMRVGYAVSKSKSANAILDLVASHRPDIIIIDQYMPGTSGSEAIRQLKAHPDHQHIPIILASSDQHIGQVALEAGANGHYVKTAGVSAFLRAVTQVTTT